MKFQDETRRFIVVFSCWKGRGNYPYDTPGKLTMGDIGDIKCNIAKILDIEVDSIVIENIIELK